MLSAQLAGLKTTGTLPITMIRIGLNFQAALPSDSSMEDEVSSYFQSVEDSDYDPVMRWSPPELYICCYIFRVVITHVWTPKDQRDIYGTDQ